MPYPPEYLAAQIGQYVSCAFQDRDGNLWFGTNGEGVCRYDGKSLDRFTTENGLVRGGIRTIAQTGDGAIWFGTHAGLSRYIGGAFTKYPVTDNPADNFVLCTMVDKAGTLWVGTGGGAHRYVGGSFVAFPLPEAPQQSPPVNRVFSQKSVTTIFEDRGGNIWFGTTHGACKYDGTSITTYTTKDGLAGDEVLRITGDRRGRIWLGCETGGASCYDGRTFRNLTSKDGLGSDRVYTILEDRAGNMWFATPQQGVSRYDGTSFTVFKENCGLVPNYWVQAIFEDKDGALWFPCSGGLFRFDGKSRFINVTRNGPWH